MTIPKETVITPKKPMATKKTVKPSIINKPSANNNNSEKPPAPAARPSLKTTEKKPSDSSMAKKPVETPPVKPPPVTLRKIPKLNPANKPLAAEKPTPSSSLPESRLTSLPVSSNQPTSANKLVKTPEKNLSNAQRLSPKRCSPPPPPPRLNRPVPTTSEYVDPFAPLSPLDMDDNIESIIGKPPSGSHPYSSSKYSRTNSTSHENTQSQSPLSPVRVGLLEIVFGYSMSLSRVLRRHSILRLRLQLARYLHWWAPIWILVTILLLHLIFLRRITITPNNRRFERI